jgi:hypothetical protein
MDETSYDKSSSYWSIENLVNRVQAASLKLTFLYTYYLTD